MSDEEEYESDSHLETKYRVTLYWSVLSANPSAIPLLEKYPEKIDWNEASGNPNAISLLEKYPKKIVWSVVSANPNAIPLLEKYPQKINWNEASANPNAISLLEQNPEKINYKRISSNPNAIHIIERFLEQDNKNINRLDWKKLSANPNAIPILEKYPQKIYNLRLSENPNAISLLQKYPDKISWSHIALNPNPKAIQMFAKHLAKSSYYERTETQLELSYLSRNEHAPNIASVLRKYKDNVSWYCLSANPNPNAIEFLEENPLYIDHEMLSLNPNGLHLLKFSEIDWVHLSSNPSPRAIELLQQYPERIDWYRFCANTSILLLQLPIEFILKTNEYKRAIIRDSIKIIEENLEEIVDLESLYAITRNICS